MQLIEHVAVEEAEEGPPPRASPSQDGAARSHLQRGDAPAVEDYEPVAMLAAQYASIFSQDRDDVLHDLVLVDSILAVSHVQALAANQANA